MSRISKSKEECFFLETFLKLKGLDLEFTKSETPDFISCGKRKIGIEFTKLLNKKTKGQKFEPAQKYDLEQKIAQKAEEIFLSRNELIINISFAFVDEFSIPRKEIEIVAENIAQAVEKEMSVHDFSKSFNFSNDYELPAQLSYFHGFFFPGLDQSNWYSAKGRFVPDPTTDEIQNLIKKKNKDLKNYPVDLEEKWLVIVEGITPLSWFDKFTEVSKHIFKSDFEKVFIVRNMANNLIELKTIKSS